MGTDALTTMEFTINYGNNVYINLEPDTGQEAKKLFNRLSVRGKVVRCLVDGKLL